MKGKLIVMEGACDGIGKTTQYKLLKDHLERDGVEVVSHHFPSYNTPEGHPVEMYLKGELGNPKDLSPYFVNSLFAIDRAITWQKKLKPAYEEGKIILLDRYTTSSMLYQSSIYGSMTDVEEFVNYVSEYEYEKLQIAKPDLVLFLYAPFEVIDDYIKNRKSNDGILHDIHEQDKQYLRNVCFNSMMIADTLDWELINCGKDNRFDSPENIHEKVYQKVKKFIEK